MAPTYQFARQNRMAPPVPPHQYYSLNDPQAGAQKLTYRGPKPSIPDFTCDDPREFARLRISLENILPQRCHRAVQVSNFTG